MRICRQPLQVSCSRASLSLLLESFSRCLARIQLACCSTPTLSGPFHREHGDSRFLFAVTFYVFEVEFPADVFLISVLEITFSTILVLQGFRKGSGNQQLSKLCQPLLINFPLSVLICLMAHAMKCQKWKAPLARRPSFPWMDENDQLWICLGCCNDAKCDSA